MVQLYVLLLLGHIGLSLTLVEANNKRILLHNFSTLELGF